MTQQEVLAYGEDRPPRRWRPALVGAALVCLAVGFLAGVRFTEPAVSEPVGEGAADGGSLPVAVVAGRLSRQASSVGDPGYRLPLFNGGDEPIYAMVVDVPGWTGSLTEASWTVVPPRAWGQLDFSVFPDCEAPPTEVEAARVRLDWGTGRGQRSVNLPQATDLLTSYHELACTRRATPTHDALGGTWFVEGGPDGLPVGTLIQFDRDGGFTLDPSGASPSQRPWMRGVYFLRRDGHMVLENGPGTRCPADERFDWVVELVGDGDHLLVHHRMFIGGVCQPGSGTWLAGRLYDDRLSEPTR